MTCETGREDEKLVNRSEWTKNQRLKKKEMKARKKPDDLKKSHFFLPGARQKK